MQTLSIPKISVTNIIICICLLVILLLVYLKTNKFELFDPTTPALPANPELLNNNVINNTTLVNFINTFITKKVKQNEYSDILNNRQQIINSYSDRVLNLINPSS
jgi:hypothetical protein